MIHILSIPFTGLGLYNGFRGDKWLKHRINVFKEFVVPSLLNQTKKEFVLWLQFRPEEKENEIVKDLQRTLKNIRGLSTIFTFYGVCLYDDKYPEDKAVLRLYKSLEGSLKELKQFITDDWVYLTCQPSDDLYYSRAVEMIQKVKPEESLAIGWDKGYIVDYATKKIAEYNPETLPPFMTLVFPKDVFLDPEKHLYYIGPYKSHEYVKDYFKIKILEGRGFCVGTHGGNISTVMNHPYTGNEASSNTLLDFGIWDSQTITPYTSSHLFLRRIVNSLPTPLHNVIKSLYRYFN